MQRFYLHFSPAPYCFWLRGPPDTIGRKNVSQVKRDDMNNSKLLSVLGLFAVMGLVLPAPPAGPQAPPGPPGRGGPGGGGGGFGGGRSGKRWRPERSGAWHCADP